jgi:hypothetical protein
MLIVASCSSQSNTGDSSNAKSKNRDTTSPSILEFTITSSSKSTSKLESIEFNLCVKNNTRSNITLVRSRLYFFALELVDPVSEHGHRYTYFPEENTDKTSLVPAQGKINLPLFFKPPSGTGYWSVKIRYVHVRSTDMTHENPHITFDSNHIQIRTTE